MLSLSLLPLLFSALEQEFITQTYGRAAFPNVKEHGGNTIIHFTIILILFLPCLFWCYPLFQCVYKSFALFLYFLYFYTVSILSFGFPLYIVFMSKYLYLLLETTQDVRFEYQCLTRSFWEIVRTKLFLVKFQTFSFQAFTFLAILPGIPIPNSQTKHFPWTLIQKTLKF